MSRWTFTEARLVLVALIAPAPLLAQSDTARAVPADTAQPPVFPLGELPARIGAAETVLLTSESLRDRIGDLGRLEERIRAFTDSLRRARPEPSLLSSPGISRRALLTLDLTWGRHQARLAGWQATLTSQATPLQAQDVALASLGDLWTRSLAAADTTQLPAEIRSRADATLQRIRGERDSLAALLNAHLTLQSVVLGGLQDVTELRQATRRGLDEYRRQLVVRTQPPLWRAVVDSAATAGVPPGRPLVEEGLQDFFTEYASKLVWHVAATLLLVLGVVVIRRRVLATGRQDEEIRQAAAALDQPVVAALAVSMPAALVLYPLAPLAYYEAAGLVATLPVILLFRRLLPRSWHLPVAALILLFIVQRLLEIVVREPLQARVATLVLSVAAAATLGWWWRRAAAAGQPLGGMAVLAVWSGMALSLSGGVLVILGWVVLGVVLTTGVLIGTFLALVFLVGIRVITGALVAVLATPAARSFATVRVHGHAIERGASVLIRLAAVVSWLGLVTFILPLGSADSDLGRRILEASLTLGTVDLSIGSLLLFGLVLWAGFLIARIVSVPLELDVLPQVGMPRGAATATATLVRYVLIAIGFMLALAASGVELSRLALIGGALGVGIGFGLQNIVQNFVSGLILTFERPIQVGDAVQVGTLSGEVQSIGVRASVLRTWDGADVIVPNGDLIAREVTNWTRSDRRRRVEVVVGVAYESDPRQVLDALLAVARAHPAVLSEPPPHALMTKFGDSSLDFILRAWTARFEEWLVIRSELHVQVLERLRADGIGIPFPQRVVHLPGNVEPIPGAPHPDDS